MRCEYCDHLTQLAAEATMTAVAARQRLNLFFALGSEGFSQRLEQCERAEALARELRRELIEHRQEHAYATHAADLPAAIPARMH